MKKRVAFYVRVSTDGQTVENQLGELHGVAKRHGWQVVQVYADRGIKVARTLRMGTGTVSRISDQLR